jgi:RNA polymerase sigma factor (sigma-70 family)
MPQARKTDSELLVAYLAGDVPAFEQLYGRYTRMVYSVCLRRLRDPGDAEDAATATFMVLVKKARSLTGRTTLAGWLQWCATNTAKKAAEMRERRQAHEKEAAQMHAKLRHSDKPAWNAALPHLDAAMAALPAAQRDVVVMSYLQGRSRSQVSEELSLPMGTVAKRARLGLDKLRRRLAKLGVPLSATVLSAGLAEGCSLAQVPAALSAKLSAVAAGQTTSANCSAIATGAVQAMTAAKVKLVATVIMLATLAGGGTFAGSRLFAAEPKLPDALKKAPVNEWVKIHESKTGARWTPLWLRLPNGKFLHTLGVGGWPLHWDNEEYDLATNKFANVYPQGAPAGYAPAEGPSKAPDMPRKGWGQGAFKKDKAGIVRIPWNGGYGDSSQAYHQYAFDPEGQRVIAYVRNQTYAYDIKTRKWSDTGAGAISKGTAMHWGSLCYDPVNKEIVSIGGSSFEKDGTPGTWVFKCAANKWQKLKLGSTALRELRTELDAARWKAWYLMSAMRNRFYLTETSSEAKVKLSGAGKQLSAALQKLSASVKSARLDAHEKPGAQRAAKKIAEALSAATALAGKIDAVITSELLASAQKLHMKLEAALRNTDFEPAPRAMSQMAFDETNKVIVLFGGDALDRQYADTWVYLCKERRWEQRWPKLSPRPRAGHALLWLPRQKKLWLGGGFTHGKEHSYMYADAHWHLDWEAWTYEVKTNQWKCSFHLPMPKIRAGYGPGFRNPPKNWPWGDSRNVWVMAATQDDAILFIQRKGRWSGARTIHALKADLSGASAALAAKHGVPPETVKFRGDSRRGTISYDPGFYDRESKPDQKAAEAVLKNLPANQWIHINPPKRVDTCGWGTSAWDPDREQWLFWGGGHSEYKGTNVFHYSTRANLWSSSARPELPLEWSGGFLVKIESSFRNRPHIPVHAYQTYAYDPPSGKVIFAKWNHYYSYDVVKREFDPQPGKLPFPNKGVMRISLETTPKGVIVWTSGGQLWRLEKAAWKKLTYNGPKLGSPWCDGSGLVYDSQRDCLWISLDTKRGIIKYDIKTGTGTRLGIAKFPKAVGKWPLWREPVAIPGTNLIMPMQNYKDAGGKYRNVVLDVVKKKYYWVDLPYLSGGKPFKSRRGRPAPNLRVTSAMQWDARRKLLWVHNPISFWVLKFDPKTAKMEEIKD